MADADAEREVIALVDRCKREGDTLGGIVEVVTTGLPPGLGSHVHWDCKLDGSHCIATKVFNMPKSVEQIGL